MAYMKQVSADIVAENTGTDWVVARKGDTLEIYAGSTGSATVTLQRRVNTSSSDGDGTIFDVKDYSISDDPEIVNVEGDWEYRMHVKTGNFTSSTVTPYIWKM
jgi:hypothetical protein